MKYKKQTLKEAFIDVLTKRPVVRPNRHFLRLLIAYEKEIYKRSFVKMIHIGGKSGNFDVPDFSLKYYLDSTETGTDSDIELETDVSIDMKLSHKYVEPNYLTNDLK